VLELLCFLVYAYEDRGEGCVSGLPGPFCPGIHLCGLLNLPTRPEERRMEGGREKRLRTEYRGSKKGYIREPSRKEERRNGRWEQIKKQMMRDYFQGKKSTP